MSYANATSTDVINITSAYMASMANYANAELARLDSFADSWSWANVAAAAEITPTSVYTVTVPSKPESIDAIYVGTQTALSTLTFTDTVALGTLTTSPSGVLGTLTTTDGTALDTLTLGDLVAIGTLSFSMLNAYIFTLSIPTLINAPNLSVYTTPQWQETYWTNLKSGIDAFVNNITGSDDIDSTLTKLTDETTRYQVAFYSQDLERKQQALRDLYSAAQSATGNKGFLFPNSMTTVLKLDAQQKYQFDLSQTSRDLIKFMMEWAKTNWQFTVDKGISAHSADVEFNTRFCDALLKSYATQINSQIDLYKAQTTLELGKAEQAVKEFVATVDSVIRKYVAIEDNNVKRYTAEADAIIHEYVSREDAKIKLHSLDMDVAIRDYQTTEDMIIKRNTANMDIAIKAYQSTEEAKIKLYTAEAEENIKEYSATSDARIKEYATKGQVLTNHLEVAERAKIAIYNAYIGADRIKLSALTEIDKNKIEAKHAYAQQMIQASEVNIKAAQTAKTLQIQAATEALKGVATMSSSAAQVAIGVL